MCSYLEAKYSQFFCVPVFGVTSEVPVLTFVTCSYWLQMPITALPLQNNDSNINIAYINIIIK